MEAYYSPLASELSEKAATIAGEMTMRTKVAPIRKSCIGVFLSGRVRSFELIHTMMMPEVTRLLNSTMITF